MYTLVYTLNMTTKTVGIKEFRANISKYVKEARKKDVQYIVMNRNHPLFEIKPFPENEGMEALFMDIVKAEKDIENGNVYTQEEVMTEFGIKK